MHYCANALAWPILLKMCMPCKFLTFKFPKNRLRNLITPKLENLGQRAMYKESE